MGLGGINAGWSQPSCNWGRLRKVGATLPASDNNNITICGCRNIVLGVFHLNVHFIDSVGTATLPNIRSRATFRARQRALSRKGWANGEAARGLDSSGQNGAGSRGHDGFRGDLPAGPMFDAGGVIPIIVAQAGSAIARDGDAPCGRDVHRVRPRATILPLSRLGRCLTRTCRRTWSPSASAMIRRRWDAMRHIAT